MYIHAESIKGNKKLPGDGINDDFDKRVVAFIRLGSDLNQNYYQIEVPLKPTSYGTDSSNKFSSEVTNKKDPFKVPFYCLQSIFF